VYNPLVHSIIRRAALSAKFLQSLTIANCDTIAKTDYRGLSLPPSLKHITLPNLQKNIIRAIPDRARLQSISILYDCASLGELQTLGEKWGSSLRQLQCIIHVPLGELGPSMEQIEQFASKFPCLKSLRYGYCECGPFGKVSTIFLWYYMTNYPRPQSTITLA
jgi:hypothetical protein